MSRMAVSGSVAVCLLVPLSRVGGRERQCCSVLAVRQCALLVPLRVLLLILKRLLPIRLLLRVERGQPRLLLRHIPLPQILLRFQPLLVLRTGIVLVPVCCGGGEWGR